MPVWHHKLQLKDIFRSGEMSFEEKRDEIVRRIKKASWYDENDFSILDPVEGLEFAQDFEEFDGWWNEFYDWADANRVWVATF